MGDRTSLLALVLAGGEGGRLDVLTARRAKPAMSFGGVYRLIDFPLSNCMHSGIADVWVLQQYQPHSLSNHLANGRPWDLDRTHGGLQILHPQLGGEEGGWYKGNADALYRNRVVIEEFGADLLLVLSADHIYKLDYRDVVAQHEQSEASVTVVTTEVAREDARRFGVVEQDGDGTIVRFEYKPDEPRADTVTAEIFLYDTARLLEALDELASGDEEDSGLEDFGDKLIPAFVEAGEARAFELPGYWRDVGTPDSYWEAHMQLLEETPPIELDERLWPIRTWAEQRAAARIGRSSELEAALLSPGCRVEGRIERSVLSPGVIVEDGAVVSNSVLLQDVRVEGGARVTRAILDDGSSVGAEATVGAADGELALVGQSVAIDPGTVVEPGERLEPPPQD